LEIQKFKKVGKGKYKLEFNNSELILYEDVILKYNLLINKKISIEKMNEILEENKYYEAFNIALNYIEIKMRCKKEIIEYLSKKNYDLNIIENILKHLEESGYINEEKFVIAYINDKLRLTTDGPFKIKQSLINYEINENIIDTHINKIKEDLWIERISKIIEKRKKVNKKLSKNAFVNKSYIYLYNLGYEKNQIMNELSKVTFDNNSLKSDYEKAYKKYYKKYQEKELKYHIIKYLYSKQYNIDEINEILNI